MTAAPEDHLSDIDASLKALFASEPGVGFSLIAPDGTLLFANAKAADMFLGFEPEDAIGKTLTELYGERWAAERLEVFQQIMESGRPAIMRHIRRGKRLQSTIRLVDADEGDSPHFAVFTVEGEHDPDNASEFDVVESDVVHLGPLEGLTRRELEVLALIGHGMSARDIARVLYRSPRTVERHVEGLREKLGNSNRVQLAEFARSAQLRLTDAEKTRV